MKSVGMKPKVAFKAIIEFHSLMLSFGWLLKHPSYWWIILFSFLPVPVFSSFLCLDILQWWWTVIDGVHHTWSSDDLTTCYTAKCAGVHSPTDSDGSNEDEIHDVLDSSGRINVHPDHHHDIDFYKLKVRSNRSFHLRRQFIPSQHSVPDTYITGSSSSPTTESLNHVSFNVSSDPKFFDTHLSYSASSCKHLNLLTCKLLRCSIVDLVAPMQL